MSTDGLLREAQEVANRNSDDPVRKVGALVVAEDILRTAGIDLEFVQPTE